MRKKEKNREANLFHPFTTDFWPVFYVLWKLSTGNWQPTRRLCWIRLLAYRRKFWRIQVGFKYECCATDFHRKNQVGSLVHLHSFTRFDKWEANYGTKILDTEANVVSVHPEGHQAGSRQEVVGWLKHTEKVRGLGCWRIKRGLVKRISSEKPVCKLSMSATPRVSKYI